MRHNRVRHQLFVLACHHLSTEPQPPFFLSWIKKQQHRKWATVSPYKLVANQPKTCPRLPLPDNHWVTEPQLLCSLPESPPSAQPSGVHCVNTELNTSKHKLRISLLFLHQLLLQTSLSLEIGFCLKSFELSLTLPDSPIFSLPSCSFHSCYHLLAERSEVVS